MTQDAWEQILEDLESRLDAAEHHLAGDRSRPVPEFVEPAVAAPIPEHLRDRAQAAGIVASGS